MTWKGVSSANYQGDKSLKKKNFDDNFYDEAEAIDKHNQDEY